MPLELGPLGESLVRAVIAEEVFLHRVEHLDMDLQRDLLGEALEADGAAVREILVERLEVLLDVVEVLAAERAVRLVLLVVDPHVLRQLRFLTKRSATSVDVAFERFDLLVDRQRVPVEAGLLAEGLAAVAALVGSHAEVDDPVVAGEADEHLVADRTLLRALRGRRLMDPHVRVVLAAYLEEHPAVLALVRVALLLVDTLVLREIGRGVVRSRTFVAEEVASVDVVRHVVLKVVQA